MDGSHNDAFNDRRVARIMSHFDGVSCLDGMASAGLEDRIRECLFNVAI